jgi:hypothetical protein
MWHSGLFDLTFDHPENWPGGAKVPNAEMTWEPNTLCEDFCIVNGEQFLIRCVLELRIVGAVGQRFGFGVWLSMWEADFTAYAESFNDGRQGGLGPWHGRLANTLKGYPETFNLKCAVHPQSNRQRPLARLDPVDHPLFVEQRDGISLDRILELYALAGHGINLEEPRES